MMLLFAGFIFCLFFQDFHHCFINCVFVV